MAWGDMADTKFRVVVIGALRSEGLQRLESVAQITALADYATEADLIDIVGDVDAILARTGLISRSVIEAAGRLRIVSRHGVGVDNVDIEACTGHGVLVTITGDANSGSVSEHAFGLMLAAARELPAADAAVKGDRWDRSRFVGRELAGKTLGLVGLGRIGARMVKHAQGFDMVVLAYDPYIRPEDAVEVGAELVSLEDLLRRSDFVSLHLPLTDATRGLIGVEQLGLIKPSAILVNTARGGLIDEVALHAALSKGGIAGAALDTFAHEPLPADDPLAQLDNLICSPHVAGQTVESLIRMSVRSAENIVRALSGKRPDGVVNPEVLQNGWPGLAT